MLQFGWIAASFALLTALVPRYGIDGAALALVIASLLRLVATLICYPALLKRPMPRLIPERADLRYIATKIRGLRSAA
jgi:O-antigen/teichoic acid export membrane protein